MSQYQTGLVDVTSGSATISGTGTVWTTNVTIGDLFMVNNISTHYEVATILTDTSIGLNSAWAGTTLTDQNYQITTDFTPNYDIPEVSQGDKNWAFGITAALRIIDSQLKINYDLAVGIYDIDDHTDETSVTLEVSDLNKVHIFSTATSKCTVYLPSVSSTELGYWLKARKAGAGEVEIQAADSDTLMDTGDTQVNNSTSNVNEILGLYLETASHWATDGLVGTWTSS